MNRPVFRRLHAMRSRVSVHLHDSEEVKWDNTEGIKVELNFAKFAVLTTVFWNVTPCSFIGIFRRVHRIAKSDCSLRLLSDSPSEWDNWLLMGGFAWNFGISRKSTEKIQVSFKFNMVNGIDMKFFWRIVEYALFDHKRNDEILEEVEVVPADEKLRRYKSKLAATFFFYFVNRASQYNLSKWPT